MPVPGEAFLEGLVFTAGPAESTQLAELAIEVLGQPLAHFCGKPRVLCGSIVPTPCVVLFPPPVGPPPLSESDAWIATTSVG